jgi:N-terminal domain of anti-restriction factor ArdC
MPHHRNRRPLTEAERDVRRQADRERIEQAARALLTSDGWQRWIRVRATNGLARYSLRNQWLIAIECHTRDITPSYVAGFRAFLALNRCVRKGEKAIKILAPVTVKQRATTTKRPAKSASSSAPCRCSTRYLVICSVGLWRDAVARLTTLDSRRRGDRTAARVRSPEGDEPVPPCGRSLEPGDSSPAAAARGVAAPMSALVGGRVGGTGPRRTHPTSRSG